MKNDPISVTSRANLDDLEREVRARLVHFPDGVMLGANTSGYRQLRRLIRKLSQDDQLITRLQQVATNDWMATVTVKGNINGVALSAPAAWDSRSSGTVPQMILIYGDQPPAEPTK